MNNAEIKTMVFFVNYGGIEFKDENNVLTQFQFHPFYVFGKCNVDELKTILIKAIQEKFPNSLYTFTISYQDKITGWVNISKNGKTFGKLGFNFSEVIEYTNPDGKKDYFKLVKVLENI